MTNIMVIDINATTSYRVKKLLEGVPVEVFTATTVYESINRVGNLQTLLDIVIVDVNLGAEDGFDLIARLKDINPNIIVIILTSVNTRKSFVRAIRVGANDYILKPFEDEYVKSKLMTHIKYLESSKAISTTSQRQIDTNIYNAVKKAIRENHELLIGLILVYNKKNPAQTANNVRDLALMKHLYSEIEKSVGIEDEVYMHGTNGFVVVLHKKSLHMKTSVIDQYNILCRDFFIEKNVDDFNFELDFINLPNEINPRQNALTVLAQRIEKNMI